MKTWYKKQNWFVQTAIQAAIWLSIFSAVTYPIYRIQLAKAIKANQAIEQPLEISD